MKPTTEITKPMLDEKFYRYAKIAKLAYDSHHNKNDIIVIRNISYKVISKFWNKDNSIFGYLLLKLGFNSKYVITIKGSGSLNNLIFPIKTKYLVYFNLYKTGILEGAQGEMRPNPESAPAIEVVRNQAQPMTASAMSPKNTSNIPLPNVIPSNLPMGGQPNTELAQALNLFNKGGIVSAKKNF